MLSTRVTRGRRRNRRSAVGAEPDAFEGHIEEICRDLAVQVKRMRQLQERAEELRTAFRAWGGSAGTDPNRQP